MERRWVMPVIEERKIVERVGRSFRIDRELLEKLGKIADEMGESKTYVLESLLKYAIEAYEEEKKGGKSK